jgi:hypothetical protein
LRAYIFFDILALKKRRKSMTNKLNDYEAKCLRDAVSFTAVRGRGASRIRADFATYNEALRHAATFGDGRTMVYAVTDAGMTAHITNA